MRNACLNQRGLTLIEVMVALALMALLSMISWRALDMVERTNERLNASTDDSMALMRVLGQIESDIRQHANEDILPSTTPSTMIDGASAMLPRGIHWQEPVLTVVRASHGGAWQQVAWGKNGDTLRRAQSAPSRSLPLPTAGQAQVVLRHVNRFAIRAWVPGQGWASIDAYGPTAATGLEIVIGRRHGGVDEIYRKVMQLP